MKTITLKNKEYRLYTNEEFKAVRMEVLKAGFRHVDLTTGLFAGTELVKEACRIQDENGGSFPMVLSK